MAPEAIPVPLRAAERSDAAASPLSDESDPKWRSKGSVWRLRCTRAMSRWKQGGAPSSTPVPYSGRTMLKGGRPS